MDVKFGLISSSSLVLLVHTNFFQVPQHLYECLLLKPWKLTLLAPSMATHLLTTPFSVLTNHSLKPPSLFHSTLSAKSTPLSLPCIRKSSILCSSTTPARFNSCFLQKGTQGNSKSRQLSIKSAGTDSGNTSSLTQNVSL